MQIEPKLGNDSASSIRVRFAWSGGVVFLIVNFWRLVPRCCYRRAGVPPVTRSRVEKWCSQLLGSVASSGSIGNGTLIQSTVGLVNTFQLATSEDIAKSLLHCCTHVAGGRGEFAMECVLSMAEAMASMDATMMSAVLANDVRASLAWVEAVAQLFADRSHTSNVFWRRKGQRVASLSKQGSRSHHDDRVHRLTVHPGIVDVHVFGHADTSTVELGGCHQTWVCDNE